MNSIYIKNYENNMRLELENLLVKYFNEDLNCGWPEKIIRTRIFNLFEKKWSEGVVSILVVEKEGKRIGFAIFQIDTPESDWCKREGWGFIREVYIEKEYRNLGYGASLVKQIEAIYCENGVKNIYLNTDDALGFWLKNNYADTGEVYEESMHVMVKRIN